MVRTRSQTERKKPKKTKFDDSDDLLMENHEETMTSDITPPSTNAQDRDTNLDSDPESDDEAPEEESTAAAKDAVLQKARIEQEIILEAKQAQREKRRKLAERNNLQQEMKREKHQDAQKVSNQLPDFLPDDLVQEFKNQSTQISNLHLKVRELDIMEQKAARQRLMEEKLSKIKDRKSMAVQKGPIKVKVQSFGDELRKVPMADPKVIRLREKWLQRRSLNRK